MFVLAYLIAAINQLGDIQAALGSLDTLVDTLENFIEATVVDKLFILLVLSLILAFKFLANSLIRYKFKYFCLSASDKVEVKISLILISLLFSFCSYTSVASIKFSNVSTNVSKLPNAACISPN